MRWPFRSLLYLLDYPLASVPGRLRTLRKTDVLVPTPRRKNHSIALWPGVSTEAAHRGMPQTVRLHADSQHRECPSLQVVNGRKRHASTTSDAPTNASESGTSIPSSSVELGSAPRIVTDNSILDRLGSSANAAPYVGSSTSADTGTVATNINETTRSKVIGPGVVIHRLISSPPYHSVSRFQSHSGRLWPRPALLDREAQDIGCVISP